MADEYLGTKTGAGSGGPVGQGGHGATTRIGPRGTMIAALRAGMQLGLRVIYPPRCLACNTHLAALQGDMPALCPGCWAETVFLTGPGCQGCGAPLAGLEPAGSLSSEAADGTDIADPLARCDQCLADPPPWARGRAALLYDGPARRLVLGFKHGDRTELAAPFARWMIRAGEGLLQGDPLLVPVPLHAWRRIRRRYNQAALLAHRIAVLGAVPGRSDQSRPRYAGDLLLRSRHTPSQEGRDRAARHANLDGAFALAPDAGTRLAGQRVVLVDDVMTSGATLAAATQVLLAGGAASVDVLVLARVAKTP